MPQDAAARRASRLYMHSLLNIPVEKNKLEKAARDAKPGERKRKRDDGSSLTTDQKQWLEAHVWHGPNFVGSVGSKRDPERDSKRDTLD